MALTPTPEQAAIIRACREGADVVIEAGAGTGKTTTLEMAAHEMSGRVLYLAYNRSTADEAKRRFPRHVECRTRHSLAYGAVGRNHATRLNAPRQTMWDVASRLGAVDVVIGSVLASGQHQSRWALDAVGRFCNSADVELGLQHVWLPNTFPKVFRDAMAPEVLSLARTAWRDIRDPQGWLRWTHDYYLKIWALSEPRLRFDAILLDEAQDSTPVITKVVTSQNAQRIAVGDSNQQLYSWLGAVDALANWPATERLRLSESWRFGPEIAEEANRWLGYLGSPMKIVGKGASGDVSLMIDDPRAILSRTNSAAVGAGIRLLADGASVGLVGGTAAIEMLAKAARDLMSGRGTSHPELLAFKHWDELVSHVRDGSDTDLSAFVTLVEKFRPEGILAACSQMVDVSRAEVILSTIHKAKGLEWSRVQLADDLDRPRFELGDEYMPPTEELMLGYVATTRARRGARQGRDAGQGAQGCGRMTVIFARRRPLDVEACMWRGDVKQLVEFGLHDVMNCVERLHPTGTCRRAAFWRITATLWGLNTKHGPAEFTEADVVLRDAAGNYWAEPAAEFLSNYSISDGDEPLIWPCCRHCESYSGCPRPTGHHQRCMNGCNDMIGVSK